MNLLKPQVFIPVLTKSIAKAANSILPASCGMIILVYLLIWRAQFSIVAKSTIDTQSIQKSDTAKWLAKQIARNPHVRSFLCSLIIADTLNLEFRIFSERYNDLSQEEILSELSSVNEKFTNSTPKPGVRILPVPAINSEDSLNTHRFGLLAQNIGILQARSIYEPNSLVKNVSISNMDLGSLANSLQDLHANLEIPVDPSFEEVLASPNRQEAFKIWLDKQLFEPLSAYNKAEFYDGINIGTSDNKLPLEQSDLIIRTSIDKSLSDETSIPNSLKNSDSPLFNILNKDKVTEKLNISPKASPSKTDKPISPKKTPRNSREKSKGKGKGKNRK